MTARLRSLLPIVLVAGAILVAGTTGTPSQPVGEGVVVESSTTEIDADDGVLRLAPDTGLNPDATASVELVVRNTGERTVAAQFDGDRIEATVDERRIDDLDRSLELAPGAAKPVELTVDSGADDVALSIDIAVRSDDDRADESGTETEPTTEADPSSSVGSAASPRDPADVRASAESPDRIEESSDDPATASDRDNDPSTLPERWLAEQDGSSSEIDRSDDEPSGGSGPPTSGVVAPLFVVAVVLVLLGERISSETSP